MKKNILSDRFQSKRLVMVRRDDRKAKDFFKFMFCNESFMK